MSSNVMSVGIMAPLNRKLTDEERDEWSEILWDQGSDVSFNYEGTMAYTDEGGDEYGIYFGEMSSLDPAQFDDLKQFGLSIIAEQARPYREYWYNGADSDHNMMELEDFLVRTNQRKI
jgi:hypothetical protein